MPITVGIDLISADEVRESLRIHADRYVSRIYTDVEQRECGGDPRLLAARFAAKEATMKALARRDEPLPWRSIGVRTGERGALSLELTGAAATLAQRRQVTNLTISITHWRAVAAAVVLGDTGRARSR